MAITEKPANTPWRRRATTSCVMEVTRPIAAMVTMKPASERTIMSLRPTRSARRPQSGPRSPAHTATSEESLTPSSCTNSGRKGEKNWKPTKAVKTMRASAQTLRCQLSGPGLAISGGPRLRGRRLLLALLDGGALHGEQLVEVDGGEHRFLHRLPVRGLALDAEAVGEVRVDLLPRREGGEERRGRIRHDAEPKRSQIRECHAEPGQTVAAREVHEGTSQPLRDGAKLLRLVGHGEQQHIGAGLLVGLAAPEGIVHRACAHGVGARDDEDLRPAARSH